MCVFQVRAEITSKEKEEEDMMEKVQKETKYESSDEISASIINVSACAESADWMFQEGRGPWGEDRVQDSTGWVLITSFQSPPRSLSLSHPHCPLPLWPLRLLPHLLGRNIYRVVFRSGQIERNELFLPGRMAYVVDLDDEFTDTDIPTTLIRSKADCPSMEVWLYFCTAAVLLTVLPLYCIVLQHTAKKLKSITKCHRNYFHRKYHNVITVWLQYYHNTIPVFWHYYYSGIALLLLYSYSESSWSSYGNQIVVILSCCTHNDSSQDLIDVIDIVVSDVLWMCCISVALWFCCVSVLWNLSCVIMMCLSWVLTVSFRLRRLWQPMTSWSQSWLRSCRTSVRGPVTRKWRRKTKVTQHVPSK